MSRSPIVRGPAAGTTALWRWAGHGLKAAGLATVATAAAWWALLYPQVAANTGLSLGEAAPCLVSTSDVCTLAMALCGGSHLFGLARYSPDLFWIGIALFSAGFLVASFRPDDGRDGGQAATDP